MNQDWKDILSSMKDDSDEATPESLQTEHKSEQEAPRQTDALHILIDRKGRKGKTATIIEGFTLPDDAVEAIASELKRKIGTGGSSRGGEILLQGDWKEKAAAILKEKGFKLKGI